MPSLIPLTKFSTGGILTTPVRSHSSNLPGHVLSMEWLSIGGTPHAGRPARSRSFPGGHISAPRYRPTLAR
jgi:hypothetical protein